MLGSLGLLKQLSALAKAPKGSAADLAKRAARLPPDAKMRFKQIRAAEQAKIDAVRASAQSEYEKFLADFGLPPRPDYRKEREVISAFVFGRSASGAGMETDGGVLTVNGRTVASRDSSSSRFLKVCPGAFGADKASRRAANAALDILGAGIRVDDIGDYAFLRAKRGAGHIVSEQVCYRVEANNRVRQAAAKAFFDPEASGPQRQFSRAELELVEAGVVPAPKSRQAKSGKKLTKAEKKAQANLKKALKKKFDAKKAEAEKFYEDAPIITNPGRQGAVDGLRRRRRRSRR
jgi:hypothetical protein